MPYSRLGGLGSVRIVHVANRIDPASGLSIRVQGIGTQTLPQRLHAGSTRKSVWSMEPGDLYVADEMDNRVVFYRGGVTADNWAGSAVYGQAGSFTSNLAGYGRSQLDGPAGMAVDTTGDLWVADSQNDRAVEYAPPSTSGSTDGPIQVIGRPVGYSSANHVPVPNRPSRDILWDTRSLALDPSGNHLYVTDRGDNRVLRYSTPTTQK